MYNKAAIIGLPTMKTYFNPPKLSKLTNDMYKKQYRKSENVHTKTKKVAKSPKHSKSSLSNSFNQCEKLPLSNFIENNSVTSVPPRELINLLKFDHEQNNDLENHNILSSQNKYRCNVIKLSMNANTDHIYKNIQKLKHYGSARASPLNCKYENYPFKSVDHVKGPNLSKRLVLLGNKFRLQTSTRSSYRRCNKLLNKTESNGISEVPDYSQGYTLFQGNNYTFHEDFGLGRSEAFRDRKVSGDDFYKREITSRGRPLGYRKFM